MKALTQGALEEQVKEILATQIGRMGEGSDINLADRLDEDLGTDSLDRTEITMILEEQLLGDEARIPDCAVYEWKTVADVIECVREARK